MLPAVVMATVFKDCNENSEGNNATDRSFGNLS